MPGADDEHEPEEVDAASLMDAAAALGIQAIPVEVKWLPLREEFSDASTLFDIAMELVEKMLDPEQPLGVRGLGYKEDMEGRPCVAIDLIPEFLRELNDTSVVSGFLRQMTSTMGLDAVLVVSESWVVMRKPEDMHNDRCRPSEASDRKEVVVLLFESSDGTTTTRIIPLERGKDSLTMKRDEAHSTQMTGFGNLANFFREPTFDN